MIAGLAFRDAFQDAVVVLVFMVLVFFIGMGIGYRLNATKSADVREAPAVTTDEAQERACAALAGRLLDKLDKLQDSVDWCLTVYLEDLDK